MTTVINKQYYNVLDHLHKVGRIKSPYNPWPNPRHAHMCIQGWIEREERYGDWITLTDAGRELYKTAVVE